MKSRPIAKILILTHDSERGQQWANELRKHGNYQVWCSLGKPLTDLTPEVVLLDGDYPVWEMVDAATEETGFLPELPGGLEFGFLRVGGSEAADVRLPVDASARELHLACSLLAEVVRLRRQVRLGSETHRRLSRQALTDPLTGLPNRRAWEAAFAARLVTAAESSTPLCLAVLDIDHFKQINDHYGHAVGDEVLRCVGRAFRESLRYEDFVARLGGDEFGLLLWLPDQVAAATVVERVRSSVMKSGQWSVDSGQERLPPGLTISASAGYHVISVDTPLPSHAELLAAADAALRKAKESGRGMSVDSEE